MDEVCDFEGDLPVTLGEKWNKRSRVFSLFCLPRRKLILIPMMIFTSASPKFSYVSAVSKFRKIDEKFLSIRIYLPAYI